MKTKRNLVLPAMLGAIAFAVSGAAMARVDVGINLGVPAPVYVAPAPVYAVPPPVYYAPPPPPPAYVVGGPVVVIGWHGNRYWDGHRYWARHDWEARHPGHWH